MEGLKRLATPAIFIVGDILVLVLGTWIDIQPVRQI